MVYKIVYFPGRGRAEVGRLVLAAAKQDWEEVTLNEEVTKEYKASGLLTFDQFPLLIDGDFSLAQSITFARYLARKHGLYGDEKEGALADLILDGQNDLLNKIIPFLFPTVNVEKYEEFKKEHGEKWIGYFEKIAEKHHGGKTFLNGKILQLSDIALFGISEGFLFDNPLAPADKFPALVAHYNFIKQQPGIAEYINGSKRYPVRKFA